MGGLGRNGYVIGYKGKNRYDRVGGDLSIFGRRLLYVIHHQNIYLAFYLL